MIEEAGKRSISHRIRPHHPGNFSLRRERDITDFDAIRGVRGEASPSRS